MERCKILLYDLKLENKEYQEIMRNISNYTTLDIFDDIFDIVIYSNTDIYHFLSVYELCEPKNITTLRKIVNMKFFQGERDTDQVILKYFQVLTSVSNHEIAISLFERFIILLNSPLFSKTINNEIFKYFQNFLKQHCEFLEKSIYNLNDKKQIYKLLVDSKEVKYVFQVPEVSLLLLENTRSKYILQEFFDDIPSWYIASLDKNILGFLYSNFDSSSFYKNVCYKYFSRLTHKEIITEFKKQANYANIKINIKIDENGKIDCIKNNDNLIQAFNVSKNISDLYTKYKKTTFLILRYHHLTNLKSLGEFLCSLKNVEYLKEFTETFDFCNLSVLSALRYYLSGFYLVGESQIVHRVLEMFSTQYTRSNSIDNKFVLNLSFSLLLLNTKMYNPNVKKKPTFEEYLSDFEKDEIPENVNMLDFYNSIKTSKIEFVDYNTTSESHYTVYIEMLKELKMIDNCQQIQNLCINESQNIKKESETDLKKNGSGMKQDNNVEANNMDQACNTTCDDYCDVLKKENIINPVNCYLMDKSLCESTTLLKLSHEKFIELCKYSNMNYLVFYLYYNKTDPYRFLNAFKHYMELNKDKEILRLFLKLKTKKYKGVISEILETRLSQESCELVKELYIETKNETLFSILVNNADKLDDINYMDFDSQVIFFTSQLNLSLIVKSQYAIKILKLNLVNNPSLISDKTIDCFKKIDDFGDEAFDTMICIQKEVDMFDYAIQITKKDDSNKLTHSQPKKSTADQSELINTKQESLNLSHTNPSPEYVESKQDTYDTLHSSYILVDKYNIRDSTKLFQFYSTSKFILNQNVLKKLIGQKTCLRESEICSERLMDDRLIYLIMKSEEFESKEVTNYSLWILNLLSTSLPVFTCFFNRHKELLSCKMQVSILKIFISRLRKVTTGHFLCCECNYKNTEDIEKFLLFLLQDKLIFAEDIEFWNLWKKEN